jgi:CRP-like cAMP-binding protein
MYQGNKLCSLIKTFSFLAGVQEEKLKLLLENAQVKKYKKGTVLLLEGDYPSAFYLIVVRQVF